MKEKSSLFIALNVNEEEIDDKYREGILIDAEKVSTVETILTIKDKETGEKQILDSRNANVSINALWGRNRTRINQDKYEEINNKDGLNLDEKAEEMLETRPHGENDLRFYYYEPHTE